jgi:hypothetical protein
MSDPAELSLSEMRAINQLRAEGDNLVREIGGLELRKVNLVGRFNEVEAQVQGVLNTVAKRLGIPSGETWRVTPEGKVLRGDVNTTSE